MKIKTRFSIFLALLVIVCTIGTAVILYYTERKVLLKELARKQEATVKQLARIGREAMLVKDDLLLLNYVNLIKKTTPAVIYSFIEDNQGKIIAHTDPSMIDKMDETPPKNQALITEKVNRYYYTKNEKGKSVEVIDFSFPVYLGNEKHGIARVGFSRTEFKKMVNVALKQTRTRIYFVALIGLFIGLLFAFIMARAITNPIQILSKGSYEIGKGNFAHRIKLRRKDEIGQLANTFNKMAQQLAQLDEMKRDFVSSVTHELRSPLGAIESYVNMMLKQIPDIENSSLKQRWEENFLRIKKNTIRLSRFINDLLDVAKIEAGKLDVKPIKMRYAPVVKDIVELFIPKAQEQKINLTYEIREGVSYVYGDEDRLKQVLTNLIGNALKFTPAGGSIKVVVEKRWENGKNLIETQVSDTGFGIPPDKIDKIFSKFEQVRSHRDRVKGQKGTGLGLTIAKAIVELHSGRIWVKSKVNYGTTFFFTLPAMEE